jgi:hypothetical protein
VEPPAEAADQHVGGSVRSLHVRRRSITDTLIGPPGVFVIDAKNYRGRLRLSHDGLLRHRRTFLAPTLSATRVAGGQAASPHGRPGYRRGPDRGRAGRGGALRHVTSMGVTVVPARRLVGLLRSLPPTLTLERTREVTAQINQRPDSSTSP